MVHSTGIFVQHPMATSTRHPMVHCCCDTLEVMRSRNTHLTPSLTNSSGRSHWCERATSSVRFDETATLAVPPGHAVWQWNSLHTVILVFSGFPYLLCLLHVEQMVLGYGVLRCYISSPRLTTRETWTGFSQVRRYMSYCGSYPI